MATAITPAVVASMLYAYHSLGFLARVLLAHLQE